jgi:heptosyltransferase-2
LVVAPGSLLALKEYPPGLLGSALQPILERREIEVLITGAASDQRATSALMQRLEAFPRVHDGTGRFSLEEHVEVVGVARTVLSMDSSTAHVAGALGIPAVVLLGGGQPGVFGPWGESPHFQWVTHPLPCFGCQWRCPFETARCLHRIPPAVVTSALESVLDSAA